MNRKKFGHEENRVWLSDVKDRVAASIFAYLERTGKSQLQLANELEIDRGQVTRYLSGINVPSLSTLKSLADLFQLPVGYFFDGDATYPDEGDKGAANC